MKFVEPKVSMINYPVIVKTLAGFFIPPATVKEKVIGASHSAVGQIFVSKTLVKLPLPKVAVQG